MGRLVQLELENFKSYRGHQVIGPFTSFTAVVGPNGAGKSNLMDAISFVLGVRSAHLRSTQLKDLVYRGRTVESRNGRVIDEAGDQSTRRAWVKAVYEDDNQRTINFQRTITSAGDSEYRINGRVVSLQTYNQTLEAQSILVKAKNFLVFQGDVEAVASQSPKDLARLIEQISGSWELHSEYSELEKQQDAAAEKSTFAYNKKRAVAAEVQSIVEQKKELELYESKVQLRTKATVEHMLHRLFVAEARIGEIKKDIGTLHDGSVAQASQQHVGLNASLQSQQKAQAQAFKAVNRQERQIKLVEQSMEAPTNDMHSVEQEMQQAIRDVEAAKAAHERLVRVETEINEKLAGVAKELAQARAEQRETARETRLRETVGALQRVFSGVHGRLAELCRPAQHKYDVAVATVLGRLMDAIVVDRQATALECIAYMKEQRAGQATFLPLDALQPAPVSDALRHAHRGARLATDVLQYDAGIEVAVLHACGGALICDTVEIARHLCYERRLDAKAVALDGTVIHRSGLITGGTAFGGGQRAQTQRWEAAAVENLRRARDRLTEELHDVSRERRRLSKDDALVSRVSGLQTRYRVARETVDALTRKVKAIATERNHAESQIAAAEPGAADAARELQNVRNEREAVNARVLAAAEPIFAEFCARLGIPSLDAFERQLLPATAASDERRLQFTTQLARLDSQCAFERKQLEAVEAQHSQLAQSLQTAQAALASLQAELQAEQQQMATSVTQIEALRTELAALRRRYGDACDDVQAARLGVEQGQRELDAMSRELSAKATELARAMADRAAVLRRCKIEDIPLPLSRGSLQALPLEAGVGAESQTAEAYLSQLSLGDSTQASASMADVDMDDNNIAVDYTQLPRSARDGNAAAVEQEYTDMLARLTAEIDALNPNPHARERLEAARVRLREIEAEHNASRQEARDAKTEFQAVRRRRHDTFMRCYNHLATAIDHAYKALTQSPLFPLGGTAYLALEDPESPYLAGVKYHAMPPLKRFRDMDQLSGGEKTVAALALLFSLQTFRPAPFFVLDEVDAALDLANVAKLANYLREHARAIPGAAASPEPTAAPDADIEADAGAEEDVDPDASHYMLRQSTRARKPDPQQQQQPSDATAAASPASADFQFIVISLKQALFERAHSLVGIYRDQPQNSSQVLTIDLEQFPA
ncbi:Structural maintenance of chromosomes protein 1 [Coemansia interrupta]|uniref:Structural maintenance of chromosomes protein n=1 Tax=Coemansia interrupta TaxID=1126814 RepID=A0A9W8HE45_9FUNG|nr:Structural maintenance of chromosomes protein 1 [Coemansia interrupta]